MIPSASSMVYRGSTEARLSVLLALRFFHSASIIWMWAQSRSMMLHRSAVASVAYTCPLKPLAYRRGSRPVWSIWAWVSST